MTSFIPLTIAGIFGFLALYFLRRRKTLSLLPLPPGPPSLPIIGNVHQVHKTHKWLQFAAWGKKYGPILHLNMLGQPVIVLSTSEAAHELLAKRGATFSDRPRMFVAQELALKHMNVLLMDYDDRFRLHQRLENTVLNQNASAKYRDFQAMESKQMLYDLLRNAGDTGTDVHGYFERATASNIFALFYGFRIKHAKEPELLAALALDDEFSEFVQVGAFLVDTFPILNILPGPLAPWKAKAESHHQRQRTLHIGNLKRGLAEPGWTFTKQLYDTIQRDNLPMPFDELAFEFGTMVDAALDGTVETLSWFILACLTQDNGFMTKARKELDAVVGRQRLPSFDDRPKLPYTSAVLEETLRWRPVGAGGVPHFTKVESTYAGYRIPAGSVVIANHWAITREEKVFGPDPESFVPDRWLDATSRKSGELKDLPSVGFGYGRRTCPGRHFARNILWISVARLLWAFDIKTGLDETGTAIPVDPIGSTDGLVMRPLPFKVRFLPRDSEARNIIDKECDTYGEDLASMLTEIGASLTKK